MANPPKPEELRRLEGYADHRPPRVPTLIGGRIDPSDLPLKPPTGLSAGAKRVWKETTDLLVRANVLDYADLAIVETFAVVTGHLRDLNAAIATEGLVVQTPQGRIQNPALVGLKGLAAEQRQLAVMLGISPGGRVRLGGKAGAGTQEGGPLAELERVLPPPALRVVGDGQ